MGLVNIWLSSRHNRGPTKDNKYQFRKEVKEPQCVPTCLPAQTHRYPKLNKPPWLIMKSNIKWKFLQTDQSTFQKCLTWGNRLKESLNNWLLNSQWVWQIWGEPVGTMLHYHHDAPHASFLIYRLRIRLTKTRQPKMEFKRSSHV